ncbi:MAG TPA: ribosome maturation factor RimM [Candidatus Limnocylindrales bacterium]|nr:ribosome maturation factor RimM [Candidatus Limnocylindrales bacterium]
MVGRVRGVHGVRGRVRVELLTDRPEERFRVGTVLRREDDATPLTIVEARPIADGPGWWLRFAEITDRQAADAIREAYLVGDVPADELADGEVYWHELIGVPVVDLDGRELGSVADVYRAGAAEVVTVTGGALGSIDVPLVGALVPEFRPREGRIVVDIEALDLADSRSAPRPRGRRTRRALAARAAETRPGPSGEPTEDAPGGSGGGAER